MSSVNPSIYIPFVNLSCSEEYISNIIKTLLIGEVNRVDLVKKESVTPHYMASIHFNYWYDNTASNNLRRKITEEQSVRIVYDDPYYWVAYKNKNPTSSISLVEKLDSAMMLIKNLQERVILLERNLPPPRPILRRSFNLE